MKYREKGVRSLINNGDKMKKSNRKIIRNLIPS